MEEEGKGKKKEIIKTLLIHYSKEYVGNRCQLGFIYTACENYSNLPIYGYDETTAYRWVVVMAGWVVDWLLLGI